MQEIPIESFLKRLRERERELSREIGVRKNSINQFNGGPERSREKTKA